MPRSRPPAGGLRVALAVLCLTLALAACGQRGPLYLPDEQTASAEAGKAAKDDNDKGDDEETP